MKVYPLIVVALFLLLILVGLPTAISDGYIAPTPTPCACPVYQYKSEFDDYNLATGKTDILSSNTNFFARIVGKSGDGSYYIVSRAEFDSTPGTFIVRRSQENWASYRAMDCVVVQNNEIVGGFACSHYFTIREVK